MAKATAKNLLRNGNFYLLYFYLLYLTYFTLLLLIWLLFWICIILIAIKSWLFHYNLVWNWKIHILQVYSVELASLMFVLAHDSKECSIVTDAFERYQDIIRGSASNKKLHLFK